MNCKECIYTKCLMRTETEFEIYPVQIEKEKHKKSEKDAN